VTNGRAIDLSAIDARIAWAKGHAARVRQLSGAWAATAIQESTTLEPDRGVQVYRAEVITDPPIEIALALGDVLQQARATLDNLVEVLSTRPASRRSGFRIVTYARRFDANPGCLDGVPGWAVEVFRSLQPVKDNPLRWIGRELAHLHELAIVDRHHALLLAGRGAGGAVIDMDDVWVGTTHPGGSEFRLIDGGRVLLLEAPADARLSPQVGATVLVQEERLRWKGQHARYPWYPSADQVADNALRFVGVVVDEVRRAAPISPR
jgi:hypothetical protein